MSERLREERAHSEDRRQRIVEGDVILFRIDIEVREREVILGRLYQIVAKGVGADLRTPVEKVVAATRYLEEVDVLLAELDVCPHCHDDIAQSCLVVLHYTGDDRYGRARHALLHFAFCTTL